MYTFNYWKYWSIASKPFYRSINKSNRDVIYICKKNKYPLMNPWGTPALICTQPEFMYFVKYIPLMPVTKKTFINFTKIVSYS